LTPFVNQHVEAPTQMFPLLLSGEDLAGILGMTITWVRSHAREIPGLRRFGSYFRFCRLELAQWLGSLAPALRRRGSHTDSCA